MSKTTVPPSPPPPPARVGFRALGIQHACVVLALTSTAAVLSCVLLSWRVARVHADAIDQNKVWADRVNRVVAVRALAARVSAAGNAALQGTPTGTAQAAVNAAHGGLAAAVAAVRADLVSDPSPQAQSLVVRVDAVALAAEQLVDRARRVAGPAGPGAATAARIDEGLKRVNDAITDVTTQVRAVQGAAADEAAVRATAVTRLQYLVAGFSVPVMFGLACVGSAVSARLARTVRDRDAALGHERTRGLELAEALAERDDLLDALSGTVIVATTDAAGRITYANAKFAEVSGYAVSELLGRDHRLLSSGLHPPAFWSDLYRVAAAGGVWRGEVRNRAKDGRLYWVDTTVKGVLGPDGKLRKMVAVRVDVTDRKEAEAAVRDCAEQLAQSQRLESIGQLAAGIAHEINTPTQFVGDNLRFLQGQFAGLLDAVDRVAGQLAGPPKPWAERRRELDERLAELDYAFVRAEIPQAIAQSIEGLDRVTAIVRAMKEFSHPGTDTKGLADLNHAIASTIEVCRNRWRYVADLETDLDPALPPVPCLVAEFNQVMLNLIVNAADAVGEAVGTDGARKGKIRVTTRRSGEAVEVRVSDDGAGMTPEVQRRIFEQFFTTKPVGKGTGQGLALSRNVIVKKHGGALTFESAAGVGTTFAVRLPLVPADAPPAGGQVLLSEAA